jgi:hypothetical protein
MARIFDGRYAAHLDKPVVLFLIGMRFNNLFAVRRWFHVASAMPKMLAELRRKPESGFLWERTHLSWRMITSQQYWRSFDDLLAYAQDHDGAHFPAWAKFNKLIGQDGSVGIWHETYLVTPGKCETIYGNMPLFGLAAASAHVKAEGRLAQAKTRMGE